MAKKFDKFSGMKDMFAQAEGDKIAKLLAAKGKIESDILRRYSNKIKGGLIRR